VGREMSAWPRGYGYLADQLRRAIASVVLNTAEGNGRISPAERRRFFQIARSSAAEVASCIDLMAAFSLISSGNCEEIKANLDRISGMLFKLR